MIPANSPQNAPEAPSLQNQNKQNEAAGAYAALLRASEAAHRLAQQTQTQWVVSAQSRVAQLFDVERKA